MASGEVDPMFGYFAGKIGPDGKTVQRKAVGTNVGAKKDQAETSTEAKSA